MIYINIKDIIADDLIKSLLVQKFQVFVNMLKLVISFID